MSAWPDYAHQTLECTDEFTSCFLFNSNLAICHFGDGISEVHSGAVKNSKAAAQK